ncbi:scoloptoxin SSD14-like [Dermacentor albipictus]|uniref:scoloptoxin SSD14-like n=1 Tax=Dermacentor albipictus TaxID=60249 RepID=UPI0038FC55E6
MAASHKKKPVSNRSPVTGTPPETLTPTDVVRGLRLCHLHKWANFKGYGFEVKTDKKGHGFLITKVDIQSPADMGGLRNDDRIIEVNGTSVNGKTYQDVLGHINEDPTKVQLLVIDHETDQEFARRHEVPSRKSPGLVHKSAPAKMPHPTVSRERKPVGIHKAPSMLSDKVIAIEELSSGSTTPVEVGKPGRKAKPVKPKASGKRGGKAKAAEVSKAEAELRQKFVRARVAEGAEADLGKAEDDTEPADRSEPPERRGINAFSANATSAFPSTPPYSSPELGYYGGFADDAPPDSAGYYWTDDQYPSAPPSSPMYAPQFSGPPSPPYAQSPAYPMSPYDAPSPMSGAGGYAQYAVPGSPYWSPPMMTPMVSYQAPYGPLMPMPSAYGYPSLVSASAMILLLIFEIAVVANSESVVQKQKVDAMCPIRAVDHATKPSPSVLGNYSHWAVTTDAAQCANVSRSSGLPVDTRRFSGAGLSSGSRTPPGAGAPSGIYAKNGSTIDAAIATLLCMGVVIPHSMGIGGGFIATIYNESAKEAQVLVARETAPANASKDMYGSNETASIWGGLAVAVPGELRGYHELHSRYGKLPWKDLFEDAINLARCGFPVGAHLAMALKAGQQHNSSLANETRQAFINKTTGKVLEKGDIFVQEDLADTLENVSQYGVDYFYNGSFAEELVQKVNAWGGVMTVDDLRNYSVRWMEPVNASFKGSLTLFSAPPPGSGPVLTYILGIMDQFRTSDPCLPDNVTTLHRLVESFKFGYAKRTLLGDMDFVNCTELVKNMTSPDFAEEARWKINDSCTYNDPEYYGFVNESALKDTGTAHVTFYGSDGIVISVSSTINYYFGSLVRTDSGVLLNNQMNDFSMPGKPNLYNLAPSQANFIVPGKRPMSSMAPMVVVDSNGTVQLSLGGTGGSLITSGIAMVSVRALWQGYNIKEAIDKRRIHHQLIPNVAMVEPSFPEDDIEALRKLGHVVKNRTGRFNIILGIQQDNQRILANSDFRKGGAGDGE